MCDLYCVETRRLGFDILSLTITRGIELENSCETSKQPPCQSAELIPLYQVSFISHVAGCCICLATYPIRIELSGKVSSHCEE
jgi:hypothetical protein